MTLIRRPPKPSAILASSTPVMTSKDTHPGNNVDASDSNCITPYPRRRKRSRRRRQCTTTIVAPAALLFTVTIFVYTLLWAPPGKNYFQPAYWRRSHRISEQERVNLQQQFPVHVDQKSPKDMEQIAHPGYLLADKERLRTILADEPDNIVLRNSNMTVPKFWDPSTFGKFGGVRRFLGNNGKYLITPTEASAIGSFHDDKETIFVALASYRDPECYYTVESIFARAKFPDRIRVGIVDQRYQSNVNITDKENADPSCRPPTIQSCKEYPSQTLCRFKDRIDWIEYPAQLMSGPIFARHLAFRMYRGEFFLLQVDSHVRFVANWDDDIVSQWASLENEMAVISTYMNDISNSIDPETHQSLRQSRAMMCSLEYEWKGDPKEHIRFNIQPTNRPKISDTPMLHPFFAAGFSFARGHFAIQVPYDQYLPFVFQGEEILQSIRAFTYGYDFYAPLRSVAYHIYAMKDNAEKRNNLHNFDENEFLFPGVKKVAYQRLIGISGTSLPAAEYFKLEEDQYGLGMVRTRRQFFETFGIHPSRRTVEERLCDFVQGSYGAHSSMHSSFSPLLRYDGMGIDYSRIDYIYKTPSQSDSPVNTQELEYLRKKLRQNRARGE
ncbi:MAG: hypothetical protein SGILL_000463 [Bacillariaceae sp.]